MFYGYDGEVCLEGSPDYASRAKATAARQYRHQLKPGQTRMSYQRYAIYDLPEGLSDSGARWLGWDARSGSTALQVDFAGLDRVTRTPAKYGFHATLKAPFRLAQGCSVEALCAALSTLASHTRPARCDGLQISQIGGFLALTPVGDSRAIDQLALECVRELDHFRAPPDAAEIARRQAAGLNDRQTTLLAQWGYPYVADEFHYHITLTGQLGHDELQTWRLIAAEFFELPAPYEIRSLALVGQRASGEFELIERFALTG